MCEKILVIIPAFNEEHSIEQVVWSVNQAIPAASVLVVDDGSTDCTAQVAKSTGAVVLVLPFNLGIGGAVQAGYLYAMENDYDVAIQIDGDGQHNPQFIPELIGRLDKCDLVIGSRFIENTGFRSTVSRRMGIRFFGGLLKLLTHQSFTDPTSGFRVGNRRVIQYCAHNYPQDFPEVEILLHLHNKGLVIEEAPVVMRERQHGQSSINWAKSVWYMVKVSLSLCIGLSRRRL